MGFSKSLRVGLLVAGVACLGRLPQAESYIVPAGTGAVITNGTIKLGVNKNGNLNVLDPNGPASLTQYSKQYSIPNPDNPSQRVWDGPNWTGLRYMKAGLPTGGGQEIEYVAEDIHAEGWGVFDATTGVNAGADEYLAPDTIYYGFAVDSFADTASTAKSIGHTTNGSAGTKLTITHDFHPIVGESHLYQCDVTIENSGTTAIGDLRYRRVMDWDLEPTPFNEYVTLKGWGAAQLLHMSNDGFLSPDQADAMDTILAPPIPAAATPIDGNVSPAAGPADHGSAFDFKFGPMPVGGKRTFKIFYGAHDSVAQAEAALVAQGANVWCLGEPNIYDSNPAMQSHYGSPDYRWYLPGGTSASEYSVAIFGFANVDVECEPLKLVPGAPIASLWPPNHKFVNIYVPYEHTGGCPNSEAPLTCTLVCTGSSEVVNGKGDGNTSPVDFVNVDEHNILVRAERSGNGTGRYYYLKVTCKDQEGNTDSFNTYVFVPKSMK
jgi:hypothetical protein